MLGFSTGHRFSYQETDSVVSVKQLNENQIDEVFEAAGEATEEAILNSLSMANTVKGYEGNVRYSFTDLYLKEM